jgi:uncharacterized protein (TIGR02598 family)
MKAIHQQDGGFSLVEVVVALGLFSFCIVAITGLLSVGLGSTRSVVNEGVAVNIAASVFGAWDAQQDGAVALTVPGLVTNLPKLSTSESNSFYFDQSGVQTSDATQGAFQMDYVTKASEPASAADEEEVESVATTTLDLIFSWPVGGATNALQTRRYSRIFLK